MCSGLKALLSKLGKMLGKVWKNMRKILVIALIVFAVFYPVIVPWIQAALPGVWSVIGAYLPTAGIWGSTALSAMAWRGAVALALAYFLDADTAKSVIDGVVDVVGDVIDKGVEIIGDVTGSIIDKIFSSPAVLLAAGVGLLWFFGRDKDKEAADEERDFRSEKLAWEREDARAARAAKANAPPTLPLLPQT